MLRNLKRFIDGWLIPPSSGMHLDAADGLRGVAIVMVVAAHLFYANPNGPKELLFLSHAAGATGTLGVPIFFVLSGFLLSIPFFRCREQNSNFWYHNGFALRRVLKIVPPFYLCILVLVLIHYFVSHDANYFKLGFAWATSIAHFVPFDKELNGSFWSLWVEIGFYAILPFLFLAFPGKNIKRVSWTIFCAMLLISCAARWLLWHGPQEEPARWHFYTSRFPCSLDFFAWGILFSALYLRRTKSDATPAALGRFGYAGLLLLATSAAWTMWSEINTPRGAAPSRWAVEIRHFLPPLSAYCLLFFVFDSTCIVTRLLASPLMRFLGIVSYEWFLIHQPIIMFVRIWSTGSHGSFLRYALITSSAVVLSLALSTLVYYQFSLRIMRWGRARWDRSRAGTKTGLPKRDAAMIKG